MRRRGAVLALLAAAALAGGTAYGASAGEAGWFEESCNSPQMGVWRPMVAYARRTGIASLDGAYVFTPYEPSAGNYVTLTVTTTMPLSPDPDFRLDAAVQAAVRLGPAGVFQLWTAPGRWLDVAAQGISPIPDAEYTISFVLDYETRLYSASVKDAAGVWRRLAAAGGAQAFPVAAKADKVTAVGFDGKTNFRSLRGSQMLADPAEIRMGATWRSFSPVGIWTGPTWWSFTSAGIWMAPTWRSFTSAGIWTEPTWWSFTSAGIWTKPTWRSFTSVGIWTEPTWRFFV